MVMKIEIYRSALRVFAPDRPERLLSGDGYGVFERIGDANVAHG